MHLPRTQPRFAHRLTVRLRGMLPVYTHDVSEGGFCADMLQPLKPGTAVEGSIAVGEEELPFQGEIVWTQRAAGERVRGRYGVRFTNVTQDFRLRLEAYRKMQGKRLVRWFT
ncbi:PilZ domain-containing protein [Myxococcus sp. RHSTA-1-4]|uniref:PilZ domain-containing protein n=1 Tax=Myxococcus sp. RHSTA-1-4 TaxID=2874601 RepID=UPI001CC0216D|nr:PilZ domain-containing protein [Myxococcus sp. RHSTA-1-4]MBZ4417993.1 PilZ domain-containing protein [Myxococcus sp. RHSTA-1-4]